MYARAIASLLVLALGCSADPGPPPARLAQVGLTAAPAPPRTPDASALVATDAGYSTEIPIQEAQRRRLAVYTKARARGKELLARGDAQAAIAAFDEARGALPYDIAILDDQGYAELLAGHLDEARTALHLARNFIEKDAFGAQVWLHIGMVEEKAGAEEEARAAYAMSQWMAPSAEAVAKLAGRNRCTALMQTRPVPAKEFARWSLLGNAGLSPQVPCNKPCTRRLADDSGSPTLALYVPRGPGVLVWPNLGEVSSSHRCPGQAHGALVEKSPPLHVELNSEQPEHWSFCQDDQRHAVPCTSPTANADDLLNGCFTSYWTHMDLFFDARAKRQVLAVVQLVFERPPQNQDLADRKPPATVTADASAVRIRGGSCFERIPLASLGKP